MRQILNYTGLLPWPAPLDLLAGFTQGPTCFPHLWTLLDPSRPWLLKITQGVVAGAIAFKLDRWHTSDRRVCPMVPVAGLGKDPGELDQEQ